ncbi:MAG: hypothetical protein KY475_21535 [Planctomycetes bacterium]|nr:hypothetical protein [Planctomycetota bacterium]
MRRRSHPPDSLDLLLDTITNAFGGILFLAILVVLLLQLSRQRLASDVTPVARDGNRLAQLHAEIEMRRRTLETQEKLLDPFSPEAAQKALDDIESLRASREALRIRIAAARDSISQLQLEVAEAEAAPVKLAEATEKAQELLATEQEALKSEIASRRQTARLPRLRSTSKLETAAVLRYGRFYLVHRNGDLINRRLNADDFVVTQEDGASITIVPKPYAGLPVNQTQEFKTRLRARLAGHDSRTVYLAIGVWTDSFGDFVHLKNALVELGFEYRLILLSEGEAIIQGNVANPQVQ